MPRRTIFITDALDKELIALQNDNRINVSQVCSDALRDKIVEIRTGHTKFKPWPSLVFTLRTLVGELSQIHSGNSMYLDDILKEIDAIEAWQATQ